MMMSRFNRLIQPTMHDAFRGPAFLTKILKQYHSNGIDPTKPLSIINPWVVKEPREATLMSDLSTTREILGPGMILLRNFISVKIQVDLVKLCEKWGLGPGGFYIPRDRNGEKLRLQMMSFGRNWDPVTKYEKPFRIDGSKPPPLPFELISLAESAIQDAQAHLDGLPSMHPDICVVNFYSPVYGRLGLHQDCDESSESLQRGLPVVSMSIGDSAEFLYGHTRDASKLESLYLESGDVLIFGGKSRLIFHGVNRVYPHTSPQEFIDQIALKPGRLNLTFRQI